jgi:type I restriction enzyme M protein
MSAVLNIHAPSVEVTVGTIPDGKVIDFLTGQPVKDTAEEYVRQNIEKALVRQYRYDPNNCLPEFPIKVGSSRKRVDIVAFESPAVARNQENAHLLVETKRAGTNPSGKQEGVDQLKSYMAACLNAKYGLWTNGEDRYVFAKRFQNKSLEFEPIVDIPIFGQSEAEAQRPKRKDLMPATADNLLFAFRRCHNYIAGTEGMQKQDAFWELLKLIFCKIEDERSGVLQFYVTPAELSNTFAAGAAKTRIQQILEDRVIEKYPKIFVGADSEINLKPNVVAYVVSQLQRFSLLASAVDVKGIAYEEIVGSNLRGDRGEFFTPRNACRMAVTMLDPQPSERLIDPACGTGGFLITAMNHALEHLDEDERSQWSDPAKPNDFERHELFRKHTDYFARNVAGLDLNPALVRAAKMNMVMNNDGEGGLFQANSLANPHTWSEEATDRIQLGSIDCLFTNPPFGANIVIDDPAILEQYDLAARWDEQEDGSWKMRTDARGEKVLQKSQPPEILFIERCVQFLVEGSGRMAMVIPNGILNNPALGYVRQWMLRNTQIISVVDMDRDLFQPKNDTQTSMVLMRRLSRDERELAAKGKLDYPVFMAVTHKIGHDKRGNIIYRRTDTGEDLLVLRTEESVVTDLKTGEERIVKLQVKDKVIDDELPEVATAFRAWLAEHP